jgi:hypothetical protein
MSSHLKKEKSELEQKMVGGGTNKAWSSTQENGLSGAL